MQRGKGVQRWVDSDPLRAKWWGRRCPNAGLDYLEHCLGFRLRSGSSIAVREVYCLLCGTLEVAQ